MVSKKAKEMNDWLNYLYMHFENEEIVKDLDKEIKRIEINAEKKLLKRLIKKCSAFNDDNPQLVLYVSELRIQLLMNKYKK